MNVESQSEETRDVAADTMEEAGTHQKDAKAIVPGSFELDELPSASNSSLSIKNRCFSAPYISQRIQSMGQRRSECTSGLEFQIESSKAHWSDLSPEGGCCHLRKHPKYWGLLGREFGGLKWGRNFPDVSELLHAKSVDKSKEVLERLKMDQHPFFKDFDDLVLGEKIAEGGQAEIYAGTLSRTWASSECVVKVFKTALNLQLLHSQWPSKLCRKIRDSYKCTGTSEILGATVLKDGRCAFVLERYWGDLRTLIDHNMMKTGNRRPPFPESVALRMLWQIATGMATLHDNNILHRDLKASNVLLNLYSHGLSPEYPDCYVADFECSVGVLGTGFWRAPEILLALLNGSSKVAASRCTKKGDVYSFGMLCYEVLTGRIPFEEKSARNYDVVLGGQRPQLPDAPKCSGVSKRIWDMVNACWAPDPWKRPAFQEICRVIEREVNERRWYLTVEDGFPYYGWRGKEQDASMVRWRWYNPGSFGDFREFYLVPCTASTIMSSPK